MNVALSTADLRKIADHLAPLISTDPRAALDVYQVASMVGLGKSTIRARIAEGRFPPPDGSNGAKDLWWRSTVTQWIEEAMDAG